MSGVHFSPRKVLWRRRPTYPGCRENCPQSLVDQWFASSGIRKARHNSGFSITMSPSSMVSPGPATNTLRVFRPSGSFRVVMSLTR